jgi:hypothetical protein
MTDLEELLTFTDETICQQRKWIEKTLERLSKKHYFVVGSKEAELRLAKILPEGSEVIYLPYVEDPTQVYLIKKTTLMKLLSGTKKEE